MTFDESNHSDPAQHILNSIKQGITCLLRKDSLVEFIIWSIFSCFDKDPMPSNRLNSIHIIHYIVANHVDAATVLYSRDTNVIFRWKGNT